MGLTKDQQKAVDCAHKPLFIQAGAGTGKTFTLTNRIAKGLSQESGPLINGVENMLIITFTRKAAAELLGRIRAELRAQGLEEAALHVDQALISTIHSMCSSILSEHALEAGIDPGAPLLESEESDALLAQAFEMALMDPKIFEKFSLLHPISGSVQESTKTVFSLAQMLSGEPKGKSAFDRGPAPKGNPGGVIANLLQEIKEVKAELIELGICTDERPTALSAYESIEVCEEQVKDLLAAIKKQKGCNWLELAIAIKKMGKISRRAPKAFKPLIDWLAAVVEDTRLKIIANGRWVWLDEALLVAEKTVAIFRTLKKKKGVRDTNDLQLQVYELLSKHPELAEHYRERFASVMVDEFQDTDPLQVAIIKKICDESLSTLTTVGDAQQSIYGFRGADLETYFQMRKEMQECGAEKVELKTNYRSHKDVLQFVDDIFSTSSFFADEFLRIDAGRNDFSVPWASDDDPRVKMLFAYGKSTKDGDNKKTNVEDIAYAQAEMIADNFQALHEKGAVYGDMAILLSSVKGKAHYYLEALRRRGIPCAISGGSDFFSKPEVITLVHMLSFLEMPGDNYAFTQLMLSDMFNLSDDDILQLGVVARRHIRHTPDDLRAGSSLYEAMQYQSNRADVQGKEHLVHVEKLLSYALASLQTLSLEQILRMLVEQSGWLSVLKAQGAQGSAVLGNINHFIDMVQDYEQLNGRNLCAVCNHFRDMVDFAKKGSGGIAKLGTTVSQENDTVCLYTIHSSKGLEFPIVAVVANEANTTSRACYLTVSEEGNRYLAPSGIKIDVDDVEPLHNSSNPRTFAGSVATLWRERQVEEAKRLLYVALTRARDMLFFVYGDKAYLNKGEIANPMVADIFRILFNGEIPQASQFFTLKNGSRAFIEQRFAPGGIAAEQQESERDEHIVHTWPEAHQAVKIQKSIGKAASSLYSYSSIAHQDKEESEDVEPQTMGELAEETVSAVGSAFHQVAEWLITVGEQANDMLMKQRERAAFERWGVASEDEMRVHTALCAWRASELFACASAYPTIRAEYPFCIQIQQGENMVPLQGFIDLLCIDDANDAAMIVDYKTGTSGSGEDLHERYQLQAWCYSYAVLSSGMAREVEVIFVRVEDDMTQVTFHFTKDDLDELRRLITKE